MDLNRNLFIVMKGIFEQVKNQQIAIDSLCRNQQTAFAIMRRIAEMPAEELDSAEPIIDAETTAKMQAGVAELEQMFSQREGDKEK